MQTVDIETKEAEVVVAEEAEAPAKKARTPQHVKHFYGWLKSRLDEKGIWGKTQQAKSAKALLLREQQVKPALFGTLVQERFGRLDRKRVVDKLVKEGKAIKTVPRNIRETAGVIHPATVDAALDAMPDELKASPERVTAAIGQMFGIVDYSQIARRTLRAQKFMVRNPGRRVPMHVREGAVLSTAIAVAIHKLFPEQCSEDHAAAVIALRKQHGMEVADA